MNIMKKIIALLLTCMMISVLVACGSESSSDINTDTLGGKYEKVFADSSSNDVNAVADELVAAKYLDTEFVKMEVQPGFLNGFTKEIKGFQSGVVFSPMIGSIPFVGYVFEANDPDALIAELTSCADPAWNICTVADETVYMTRGNLVFFLMCSNEE